MTTRLPAAAAIVASATFLTAALGRVLMSGAGGLVCLGVRPFIPAAAPGLPSRSPSPASAPASAGACC